MYVVSVSKGIEKRHKNVLHETTKQIYYQQMKTTTTKHRWCYVNNTRKGLNAKTNFKKSLNYKKS